ncbi:MAG: acylphosphatase [Dehalococcoidales bacterium]|nr:acylphosphatase [Dehalococcoidales bacterium]
MSELASFRAVARGRVQGVYYRSFTARNAALLDLTGYVRNRPDGSVEVYAEGEKVQLEKLAEQLKTGPPAARVDNLTLDWKEYTGEFRNFVATR